MRHAWRYIVLGIAAYIPILLATFPLERMTGAIERRVEGLSLQSLDGSLFTGTAGSLRYQGNEYGPVSWRFSPGGLLRGRLEYRLELENPDYPGHGLIGIAPDGALIGRDIALQLVPDRIINAFAPVVAVASSGKLGLQLEGFALRENRAQDVTGQLDWEAAELLAPLQLPLGDIRCAIESADTGLVARIIQGGTLGATGDVTLAHDGRYTVRLLLAPGPEVDANTRSLLETMLPSRPDGKFPISAAGRLVQ